ncbi:MAG: PIG-L family deacetylase [Thermoanaerobaculia bacterium]
MTVNRWICRSFALLLAVASASGAQTEATAVRPERTRNAAEIRHALDRLGVVGAALYVAAHPDDENTAMLAWLANGRLVRAGYLATTRGDGGQNLIGPEKGELLGVIRTQELLEAREIDNAEQLFSRAIDFGYSKTPEETLRIWGKDRILRDFVAVIRDFKPDIIITRFPSEGGGHGHHTASAILAEEAFRLAGDASYEPRLAAPWQPKRLFWNAWRTETAGMISVDLGEFNRLLGSSYTEIAGESRSMHKSQGFGAAERRGTILNWLELRGGDPAASDPFEGIDLTWNRVTGGAAVIPILERAKAAYRADEPWRIVPPLVEMRNVLQALPRATAWERDTIRYKMRELDRLILDAAGIWIEAIAPSSSAVAGSTLEAAVTVINRSPLDVVAQAAFRGGATGEQRLRYNDPWSQPVPVFVPEQARLTHPYWLRQSADDGAYSVPEPSLIGAAVAPDPLRVPLLLTIYGEAIAFEAPVMYRWTDPVLGERYRPVDILPPVTANLSSGVLVFPDTAAKRVRALLESAADGVSGVIRPRVPEGWSVEPAEFAFAIPAKGGRQMADFVVTPPAGESEGELLLVIEPEGWSEPYSLSRIEIDYPHITPQTLLPYARAKLVRADIERDGRRIGYVMGAGDEIPESLRQIGYEVTLLSDEELESADLSAYDAIVLGVRAYNTRERLAALDERLFDYVERGGTLVTQYNTLRRDLPESLGPYPLQISRERVTVEDAPVQIAAPEHPLLATPNAIRADDFEGWVQERGLYFADAWSPEYEALLVMEEPGEEPKRGSLLVARHGRGTFVYTSISFFRQLPAGVPGAYRLFANLVAARDGEGTR